MNDQNKLEGNPHYSEASHGSNIDNYALTQATLALAYEQRTANLIALLDWMARYGKVSHDLATQIDDRLGMGK